MRQTNNKLKEKGRERERKVHEMQLRISTSRYFFMYVQFNFNSIRNKSNQYYIFIVIRGHLQTMWIIFGCF